MFNIHPSWESFFQQPIIQKELNNIFSVLDHTDYFPSKENIFRFAQTDRSNVKVILVGMEPYPSTYEKDGKIFPVATGRSFEIANVDDWKQKFKQSSLRNILKTIYYNETGMILPLDSIRKLIQNGNFPILPPHDWFSNLEDQGVLFLNASLTVKPYVVKSHTALWEVFMKELVKELDQEGITWLLWGKDAQNRILPELKHSQAILSCHPRLAEFVFENCFANIPLDWKGGVKIDGNS